MADFVRNTQAKLMNMLVNMLTRSEAEEVMQEAYLKVFIQISKKTQFEPQPFLFRVARNLAISRIRHQKVISQHACQLTQDDLQLKTIDPNEEAIYTQDQNQLLIDAVNSLPPACRQVFIFRKRDEKSHSEIAQLMNISVKTVENHLTKGMKLCRLFILKHSQQQSNNPRRKAGAA
ncbi:MAG: RNA polymerase sigma factor (sigma-70 family) [Paraglaciecola sp.]|jgi:RNA polymerase sigma factor (sigma-70 family)